MKVMNEFIGHVAGDDRELFGKVSELYGSLFENSATDINKKQIAAQPGTCTQGIVPNGQLTDSEQMPTDETVARLMKESYKSRFGQWCGSVSPGRTSLGMWGGTGPENANADTSTAQS